MPPRSREEFKIAIICALPVEADAVQALFDENYDQYSHIYGKQPGDDNTYATGKISGHDVVLAFMPGMGNRSSASVARSLRISFTGIKLALVVGICGGAPYLTHNTSTEIILGDVIISDSVVEYDFGRQYPDGFVRKRGINETLEQPNQEIRSFLNSFQTTQRQAQVQQQTARYLKDIQGRNDERDWRYPGVVQDILFTASHRHKHYRQDASIECVCMDCHSIQDPVCELALNSDCQQLGCTRLSGVSIRRHRLDTDNPETFIHIGRIASANTVMRSGAHRDELAKNENIIGFEMEGAGVWDILPCLIIKGVCDYADSHKNKRWQNYAAATSACCVKALLKYWVPGLPHNETSVGREDATMPTNRITLRSEDGSMMSFSSMDLLSLTTNVLASVAAAADTLRACQKYAARLRIVDLSTASLHTDCATIRLELRQIETMMTRDKDGTLEDRYEAYVLEEYDGVLQACRLPFSILNIHLEQLEVDKVKELDRRLLATKLQDLWRNQQMDMICHNISGLARAIHILSTAFQSDTPIKTSEIIQSSKAKEVLRSISSDAASLHESVQSELRGDAESARDSVFGDESFGFDEILMNTTLYRRYFSRQTMNSKQREFLDYNGQEQKVPPVNAADSDTSLATAAGNFLEMDSCSSSSTSTIHATSAVVQQVPRREEPVGLSGMDRLPDLTAGPSITPSSDVATTTAPIRTAVHPSFPWRLDSESDASTLLVSSNTGSLSVDKSKLDLSADNPDNTEQSGNVSPSAVKSSRQPTLSNILMRKTLPPYTLYDFYIYMRDIQRGVNYLDFWLDAQQHNSLYQLYTDHLVRSGVKIDNDDSSSSISPEGEFLVQRQDVHASAQRILYMYLLPGSEREIVLPAKVMSKAIDGLERDGRDDPQIFEEAKDYVFLAMEQDAFPGFLNLSRPLLRVFRRSATLGPLVNRLSKRN